MLSILYTLQILENEIDSYGIGVLVSSMMQVGQVLEEGGQSRRAGSSSGGGRMRKPLGTSSQGGSLSRHVVGLVGAGSGTGSAPRNLMAASYASILLFNLTSALLSLFREDR